MRGVSLAGAEVIHVTQKALLQASKSIVVCNDFFYFLIFLFDKQFLSRSWLEITAVLSQQNTVCLLLFCCCFCLFVLSQKHFKINILSHNNE